MPPYISTIIKKQNGRYLFIGAKSKPCHRSKKVLFLPYLSFETKKSFLVGGWWWVKSDFSVSLCPFLNLWTYRKQMDTEPDKNVCFGALSIKFYEVKEFRFIQSHILTIKWICFTSMINVHDRLLDLSICFRCLLIQILGFDKILHSLFPWIS